MLTRRDALRAAVLAAAAGGTGSLLAGCGASGARAAHDSADPIALLAADVPRSPGSRAAIPGVVDSLQGFAGRLFGRLAADPGNLALSPYSVAVALAMTVNGAAGRTASEMRRVLGIDDLDSFNAGLDALTATITGLAGPVEVRGEKQQLVLDSADTIVGDRSVAWEQGFLDVLAQQYGAGLRAVDFAHATEQARAAINGWTARRTHGRIPELFPPGVLTDLTRLVLVNALYLAAPWAEPLEKHATGPRPFHLDDGRVVDVDTMSVTLENAMVGAGPAWTAARVPYAGGGLAMTLVLPDPGALATVSDRIASGGLGDVLASLHPGGLALSMPRWRFRTSVSLEPTLRDLGMPTAFEAGRADFTPMTREDLPLHIDAVLHQAWIAVDEDGTEAAAATAVDVALDSAPMVTPFAVDRPFLFVIHDVAHGTPLLLGRVTDPRTA